MKLCLLGDVHASPLLKICLDFAASIPVDRVLCVGDLADGPGSLSATIALIRTHDVLCVRGNHDRWLVTDRLRTLTDAHSRVDLSPDELAWITALPVSVTLETDRSIVLTHSLFDDDMMFVREDTNERDVLDTPAWQRAKQRSPAMRTLVTGHTHQRMVRAIDGVVFINPGTLHADHQPGFMVFDTVERSVRCFDFDATRTAITEGVTISLPAVRT